MARRRKLSRREYLQLAWTRGLLTYKLYDYQDELYLIVSSGKSLKTVLNISRRYGKTTVLLLYCLIFAIKNPNSLIRFASPTQKSLKKIVRPIMRMLLEDCPKELRPKWNSVDGMYTFKNGSEIHLAGVNNGHADDLRGQKCDLGVIDEAGVQYNNIAVTYPNNTSATVNISAVLAARELETVPGTWKLVLAGGIQGEVGPQGLKGDTGSAGPAGPAGSRGPIGSTGPTGSISVYIGTTPPANPVDGQIWISP